jgi:hypothetical protein
MAKHNVAVALGLLGLLAVTWATGTAHDVPQHKFKIEGSADYLRGMYSMIEAPKFKPLLSENFGNQSSPDKIRSIALQLHKELQENRRGHERKRYHEEIKLIEALVDIGHVDKYCFRRDQWILFLFANQVGFPKGTKNTAFKNYVNHVGKQKLAKCASQALDYIKIRAELTSGLDTFFKALFRLPEGADDRQLCERLTSTNLLEDELHLAPTLKLPTVIETVRGVKKVGDSYELKDGGDVMAFISDQCSNLAIELHGALDMILLREDHQVISKLDDKVKKWIEYDHACWYLVKYEKKFIRHVDRLLGTQSALRTVADLITCHDCRARS